MTLDAAPSPVSSPDGRLDAHLVVERDGFTLDLRLTAVPGEVVALLGPNGAGKTTALRALAGLQPLHAGHLRVGGVPWDEPARRVLVPPARRGVGVVFQDHLLFPHLSALDNVAFGPRSHGTPRRAARDEAARWLDRVGLAGYARRRPRELSGGQAQRVALARALAVRPRLLLLDEPLAALDARTRQDTRADLRRHLAAHTGVTVLVSHDPLDAMVLADRLVIIEDGMLVQAGDAATVTARPRTEYVARLVGLNLYRGRADGASVTLPGGFTLVAAEPQRGEVFVAFAPSAVALYRRRPDGSPRNTWPATVVGVAPNGDRLRVELAGPLSVGVDLTTAAAAHLGLRPGQRLWASLKASETAVYPADPDRTILGGRSTSDGSSSPGREPN
ncbi:ABC transporter ATP-binding protein [Solwaraspora sp. WMMD406]|uniref:ABC transporter ATP-binding protein n=1 Tax=Solwaraspora sp. WMMD406 TaxID=3016095 RepID=UPI002417A7C9|nr:ABC transporter ATP-binding protein [Solwaraspora sp. WMMD406]MDG4764068.1 ABC transporter ATP-binding protein [Solwaraspora sp. WMMD406]